MNPYLKYRCKAKNSNSTTISQSEQVVKLQKEISGPFLPHSG